uniref:Uncharacterized protein n=1 Tax=Oryza barthii TaxID=65489 RepID=A0A0D3HD39_9ORYZ
MAISLYVEQKKFTSPKYNCFIGTIHCYWCQGSICKYLFNKFVLNANDIDVIPFFVLVTSMRDKEDNVNITGAVILNHGTKRKWYIFLISFSKDE